MKKLISVLCTVLIVLSTVIPTVYAEPYDMESVQSAVTLSEETEHNHTALAESAQAPTLLSEHTHTGTLAWESDEQVHSKYWTCCHEFELFMVAHNWVNGKCTECGYVCTHMGSPGDCSICGYRCNHSGGTATCTQKAVCDKCGEEYGEVNSSNHTGTFVWQSDEHVHSKYWTCCHEYELFFVAHTWVNGKCTECGYVCHHIDSPGDCSICGYRCNHSGGTATCTQQAVCDKCGEAYGELNSTNHTGTFVWWFDQHLHTKYWTCCDQSEILLMAHNWANSKCTDCGYVCTHMGSPATCTKRAVCDICGETYGDVNPFNHSGTFAWDATETEHKKTWNCCGRTSTDTHTWENGECTDCRYVCGHFGGTATCTQQAVCNICSEAYGNVKPSNHSGTESWKITEITHQRIWGCCGKVIFIPIPHTWENGVCTECGFVCEHKWSSAPPNNCNAVCDYCKTTALRHQGQIVWSQSASHHSQYWSCCMETASPLGMHNWANGVCTDCRYVCGHTGGTATCTQQAVCNICSEAYGDVNPSNHSGTQSWKMTETTHQRIWGCCGKAIQLIPRRHTWENGECTDCGYVCGHTGGTATCTQKAVCDECGEAYGELDDSNHSGTESWKITETTHQKIWGCCGKAILPNPIHHTWENGECTDCGYVCGHTGGTATCTQKAVCTYCHNEYGELDPTNHPLEYIPATDATVTATGNDEYWHCLDCGKYFADQNAESEISLDDTIIDKLPPEIIEGMNQTVTEDAKQDLVFRSNAAFDDFIRVELDGEVLDEAHYTVEEGSTIVTLQADYVATLAVGEHTLGIVSESGTATTTFTVQAKAVDPNTNADQTAKPGSSNSAQTGDTRPVAGWIVLFLLSGSALGAMALCRKKSKI